MQQFKQGDTVRTKSGGPVMTVDGYTPEGEVTCTYWDKSKRLQDKFVEETLQAALDIGMPELTGYDVARQVRQEQTPGPYLVALTGWGTDKDRADAKAAGFDAHLT
jgi:uncharacterized protein YodC (DUF2158 family)